MSGGGRTRSRPVRPYCVCASRLVPSLSCPQSHSSPVPPLHFQCTIPCSALKSDETELLYSAYGDGMGVQCALR